MFVGEIGIPRREFLYDIKFWEANRIIRGYNRRCRNIWSATRWQTYNLMIAWVGSDRMEKAGIHSPTELLSFPWDVQAEETPSVNISQEEIERMREEMRRINESKA